MNGLTSGKLAEILQGQLTLGTMPPLGGEWEPVHRVVFESSSVERGDVYWDVANHVSSPHATGVVEEAFARGAAGVASCRYIEPWAGAFSVQLADPHHALERLAQWVIIRSKRRRILVVDAVDGFVTRLLQVLVIGDRAPCPCMTCEEVAMQTIRGGLSAHWDLICVPATAEEHLGRISDLCAPRVAVITSAAIGRMDLPALLDALPQRGAALLASEDAQLPYLQTTSTNVIRIGAAATDEDAELKWGMLVGKQLGFSRKRITDAYRKAREAQITEQDPNNTTRTCKVPPLVSGLRESDAALPPGLKRWAC
jgi:hypothetical protein